MTAIRFDADLVRRHGGRGPRYTSYPTAVQFHDDFGAVDYLTQVQRSHAPAHSAPLSLYLHLPFCRSLCYYCACTKFITRNEARAQRYLECLKAEAAMHGRLYEHRRQVEQVHLGGGTPTFYDDAQLASLMAALREHFSFASGGALECSVEVDPRTAGPERIRALAALGFNRLSLGVQDFDEAVQRAVNRLQPAAETIAIIEAAREAGYASVSMDLIYGLPLQTPVRFERTLDTVIRARPDRISLYSYAHLPQMFRAQRLIDASTLPDDSTKLALLECSVRRLTGEGYEYIGMDHFALADDALVEARRHGELQRNFQGYSTHARCDLVAFGASAIGSVADAFYQNEKNTNAYCQQVEAGHFPIVRGLELNEDDRLRASIIQQLMCQGRLDIRALEARHGVSFGDYFADALEALQPLEADGLVRVAEDSIRVTPSGQLLLRPIAMAFDRYLCPGEPTRFSKVI